ncbi:MAG TPA: restriction endonuclease subunit S [Desulfovibrio sp.]|uniref:restriction endonuclease subunit S n=1 Tax=Desulfovibrio sp. TaxID=885 RepID=UPI002C02B586|nr:restriction endonuclease subunit S [Desulfovibrio sp.]HMM39004.1 restriction endonuclease subunit S [Desulfovibrio sp.]
MNRIDDLIAKLCPKGVEFKELGGLLKRTSNIRWQDVQGEEFQYIDLTSVDRNTHVIGDTETIDGETAPSRAQQIVHEGDVIFGTTRPMLKRYCLISSKYDKQICSTGFCVLRAKTELLQQNFLFHLLGTEEFYNYVESNQRGASYPSITDKAVKAFRIPVPPLDVQREIVKVLDAFTQLEAELEAELEARRRQYQYYRDALLSFAGKDDIRWATLGEVAKSYRGTAITEAKTTDGIIPVVANSPLPVYFHGESNRSGETIVVARSGAYAGLITFWDQPIFLTDAFSIHPDVELLNTKFVYYFLQNKQSIIHSIKKGSGVPHVRVKDFESFRIPIPPLSEQARIVAILDTFDALVNDLTSGLPAEIAARRTQYAHYRDRLLTFREAA